MKRKIVFLLIATLFLSACSTIYGDDNDTPEILTATPVPKNPGITLEKVKEVVETAIAAIQPTAAPIAPKADPELKTEKPEGNELVTKWFTANVPGEVVTIKKNTTGGCTMPTVVCYMLDDSGVLGADKLADADANPSAIWTGSANHMMAQSPTVGVLIPEGSYLTAYADSFTIDGGGYHLEIPSCGPYCAQGFLARGWFGETHIDKHVPITISNYGATGAMKFTRYPVPIEAGQFFSQDYLNAQAQNALKHDNCGDGEKDCDNFYQWIMDYNDGSLTLMSTTDGTNWTVLYTNIVSHGRHD